MERYQVIALMRQGESQRSVVRQLGIHRNTVKKIWNRYLEQQDRLNSLTDPKEIEKVIDEIVNGIKYDSSNRKKRVLTDSVKKRMKELMDAEKQKDKALGKHKQQLTAREVYEILVTEGIKISERTVSRYWKELKKTTREAYIRQEYEFGQRVEFDFGEVKLEIQGVVKTYHLAVWAAPASNFFWAYLYTNQGQEVFLEAHIKFFELVGGVYQVVVYDNMKNVVKKIGKEKEYNDKLVQLSLYYGFEIDTTNCRAGNEKGTVEGKVKKVRKKCFSSRYQFDSLEDARLYLQEKLEAFSKESKLEEEKKALLPYRLPFETADMHQVKVGKYSMIQFEKNYYSVPDYLVGYTLQLKDYAEYIVLYSNESEVCRHKIIEGRQKYQVDIYHYLSTLMKKPGALANSVALKQDPELRALYNEYYIGNSRKFIEIGRAHV